MESLTSADIKKANMLLVAAASGNVRKMKIMAKKLDKGKGIKETIASIHDSKGEGALHFAARGGRKEVCQYLIENLGFDPNLHPAAVKREDYHSGLKSYSDKTPLHCALVSDSLNTIVYLIAVGANLNARDENFLTPLHSAVIQGKVEALGVLASSEWVQIDARHVSGTPLLLATAHNNEAMVKILLDNGADPNMNYPDMMYEQFITPLVVSVLNGSKNCAELLIKAGADVNKVSVLEMCVGSMELLNCLLECGADPNMPNKYGRLAIEVAAVRAEKEAVETLLPLTSPIQTVQDWSVEGIFTHFSSEVFKKMEKIRSVVKIAKLKEVIDEVFDRQGYTVARYLCFYALQEDPKEVNVLVKKTICKMKMDNDMFQGLLEIHTAESPRASRLLSDTLFTMGNSGAATFALMGAMSLDPHNPEHLESLKARGRPMSGPPPWE